MRRTRSWYPTCRRGAAAIPGLGIVVLAVTATTSVALACTNIMGPLTVTPTSGAAGTVITTSSHGLKTKPAKYALHFSNRLITAGGDCMSFRGVSTLKTIPTDSAGGWSNVTARIPSTATRGAHALCGMEVYPTKGDTGTAHDTFTVV